MAKVKDELEAGPETEVTSEEVRWRMEKVVQFAAASGHTIDDSALQFNKALAVLGGQGEGSQVSYQSG